MENSFLSPLKHARAAVISFYWLDYSANHNLWTDRVHAFEDLSHEKRNCVDTQVR